MVLTSVRSESSKGCCLLSCAKEDLTISQAFPCAANIAAPRCAIFDLGRLVGAHLPSDGLPPPSLIGLCLKPMRTTSCECLLLLPWSFLGLVAPWVVGNMGELAGLSCLKPGKASSLDLSALAIWMFMSQGHLESELESSTLDDLWCLWLHLRPFQFFTGRFVATVVDFSTT